MIGVRTARGMYLNEFLVEGDNSLEIIPDNGINLIKNVIIPKENESDLQEIPDQILKSLNIIPVDWVDEVISHALVSEPTPLNKSTEDIKNKTTRARKSKTENKQAH